MSAASDAGASAIRMVKECAACGRDHAIEFFVLMNPFDGWTERGTCPLARVDVYSREDSE